MCIRDRFEPNPKLKLGENERLNVQPNEGWRQKSARLSDRCSAFDCLSKQAMMSAMSQVIDQTSSVLRDSYGRAIRDLRVSLTDRCNFRCFYCLPHGEPPIAPKEKMLSYEAVSYTHLRAHETPEHLVCRLLLEKKKKN